MRRSRIEAVLDALLPARADGGLEGVRIRLVTGSGWLLGLLAACYVPLYLFVFHAPLGAATLALAATGLVSTPLVLRATGSPRATSSWLLGVLLCALIALSAEDGGIGTPMFALPLLPVVATVVDTNRAALGWAVATLAAVAGLLLANAVGLPLPDEIADAHRALFDPAVALGVTVAAAGPTLLHRALADRAGAELRGSHAEIRAILDSAADGIVSLDERGRVLSANLAVAELLDAADPVGRSLTGLLGLDGDLDVGVRACRRTRASGSVQELEITVAPIRAEGAARRVATLRDVTVHREAARAMEARDRAIEATRAKSGFLANMSHELRTPLNAILGYTEVILEEVEETGKASEADLRRVHEAGRHLLALIDDVLDLSRIEAGRLELRPEPTELGRLVEDVAETVRPICSRRGSEVVVEVPDGVGSVLADPLRLRQILLNLAGNAAKFTELGRVGLRVTRAGDQVAIDVWDTGIGIAADRLEAIFDEFVQADASTTRRFGGTGLGLAISRRLARMMGGDITAASRVGAGSTFRLTVPLVAAPPAPAEPPNGSGPVVVVLDDDPSARDLVSRALLRGGFRVVPAEDGPTALRLCRELHPAAITLDVLLPGMDGWQVLAELKADPTLKDIPVVLVTMVGDRSLGLSLGAAHHLTKPVDRDALLSVVRRVVTGGASVLVVEDDGGLRELLARTLRKAGYQVGVAENGKVGLDRLEEVRPSAVLLDLTMPVMDGFDFLATLRRDPRWSHLPVVVLTARDLTAEERAWLLAEAQRVLAKTRAGSTGVLEVVLEAIGGLTTPPGSARTT